MINAIREGSRPILRKILSQEGHYIGQQYKTKSSVAAGSVLIVVAGFYFTAVRGDVILKSMLRILGRVSSAGECEQIAIVGCLEAIDRRDSSSETVC